MSESKMDKIPTTFEEYKKEMKNHWEEEIISPGQQHKKFVDFFKNQLNDYTINCLFLELSDLQIYLSEQIKENNFNFNEFFQKNNQKVSNINNFPFVYPFQDGSYILKNSYRPSFIKSDIQLLIKTAAPKVNLVDFIKSNPHFGYYFWNVTFPNIFCGFISHEYCKKAVKFLNLFENERELYLEGVASFINHNYYFQDSFLKSFFLNSQNESENENAIFEDIQAALKKAVQRLTIQQLDILEKIIDNYPEEARTLFLNDIIIRSIKLWEYSPLCSPLKIFSEKKGKNKLISDLQEQFANNEKELDKFLVPIFESIKSKVTFNDIHLKRLIFNDSHEFTITFLDILIITKVVANDEHTKTYAKFLNNFNNRYFLTKAYRYIQVQTNFKKNFDLLPKIKRPDFDLNLIESWKKYKILCQQHNKNPLKVFYDESEFQSFNEQNPQLAHVGIALSYYDWYASDKTEKVLKMESSALIPLKSINNAQLNFFEIFSHRIALLHPMQNGNFLDNIKDLYINSFKALFSKYLINLFKSNLPNSSLINDYKKKLVKEKRESNKKKIERKINDLIKESNDLFISVLTESENETSQRMKNNFDYLFNHKDSVERISEDFQTELRRFHAEYLHSNSNTCVGTSNKKSFILLLKYLKYFTRAYLIIAYDEKQMDTKAPNKCEIPKSNDDMVDSFDMYSASGIFNYINLLMVAYDKEDFQKTNKAAIGQIFAAVPVLIKYFSPFVVGSNALSFCIRNNIDEPKDIIMLILRYTFDYNEEVTPEDRINQLRLLLFTAYNVLISFNDSIPFFSQLRQEFEFLNQYLFITNQ